ncbi:MAG: hypothetical protein Kow0059_08100 [Candidatus Sumerlaeia bacterium]
MDFGHNVILNEDLSMIAQVFVVLGVGFAAGLALRGRPRALRAADHLLTASICFFLFVLGLMAGANRELLGNVHRLGLQSFLIALAGVTGSVLAAAVLAKFILRDSDVED